MQRVIPLLAALLVAISNPAPAGTRSEVTFRGVEYDLYRCDPGELRIFWKDANGTRYGQFSRLHEAMKQQGAALVFALNAGIFKLNQDDYSPCGLHIEDGRLLVPLNEEDGAGNFYLKPNGVFCVTDDGARIFETGEFAATGIKPRLALQSGPLLLRDNRIHPKFDPNSLSRLHRNGVGIANDGSVIFAMTKFRDGNRVNLHDFAELFRHLGCRDALFLDGDISMMWTPEDGPAPAGNHFAAILGIIEPAE